MSRISNGKLAAYSAPALPIAAFATPLAIYAPPFFATDMGLGLAATGTVFMAARFWDLGTDPLMGVISDKFPSRWGRRRHWMVLSVPVLLIATALVMFPDRFTGGAVSTAYLLGALFLLYLGYTMLTISHMAWGAELSADYHERSRIQGWREFAQLTSMAAVLLIPAVLEQTGYALSSELKMNSMGLYVMILLPVAVLIAVTQVGEPAVKPVSAPALGFVRGVKILAGNRYILRILVADLFIHVPSAIRASLYLFYVSAVIGMPEWSAIIMLSYFAAGPIAVPLWVRLARRMSKHSAVALGVFLHVAVTAAYMIPGEGDALLFAGLFFASGIVYAGVPFLIRSMVADIVDYDRLRTGQDRTALYYSTVTTTMKVGGALGIGLAYPLLALVGFNPDGPNDPAQLDALRYIFAFIPAVSELLVVYLLYTFPLNEEKLREVQAQLAKRQA
ncbi:MAG: MFS transporter [Gammaproteobacteria bacterium]|nr:MFS transporter [Gammaproteobacteria bacterium]